MLFACHKGEASGPPLFFDSIPTAKTVIPIINEGSGIADSKANPGFLWVEEDSGNPPQLYLISHDGTVSKKIYIKGAVNRDWEDMALVSDELYIADIGDNAQTSIDYFFYKFTEPTASADTVTDFTTIRFRYPDGSHDAEAFLVDPSTKDIYIITKRDSPSRIYKLAFPYNSVSYNAVEFVGALPYPGVVSAALSADGKEIIVKTYTNLYYYQRQTGESLASTIQKNFTILPYKIEPQGEAVTFAYNNSGIYTLSEKGFGNSVILYFYQRK
jgi:dipeptidyl aminopeptidase/acylaminoacyl peptidase